MIRTRGVMLIVLSMVLAVGAAWAANRWLQARAAVPDSVAMATVVTAAMDIPFGTTIEARHLATIQMLEGTRPDASFKTIEEVEGKIARAPLLAGEILLAGRFTDQANGSTLAAVVEKSMRAMTVRVDDVVGLVHGDRPGHPADRLDDPDVSQVTESHLLTVGRDVRGPGEPDRLLGDGDRNEEYERGDGHERFEANHERSSAVDTAGISPPKWEGGVRWSSTQGSGFNRAMQKSTRLFPFYLTEGRVVHPA